MSNTSATGNFSFHVLPRQFSFVDARDNTLTDLVPSVSFWFQNFARAEPSIAALLSNNSIGELIFN